MKDERAEYYREYYKTHREEKKARQLKYERKKRESAEYVEMLNAKKRLQYKRMVEAQGRTYRPYRRRSKEERGDSAAARHLLEKSQKKNQQFEEKLRKWTEKYNKLFT